MPIPTNKDKYLHYRKATFLNPNIGITLQEAINQALSKRGTIGSRSENVGSISDQIGGWTRFVNTHLSAHGMEFGVLVLLEPNQNKLIIDKNNDVDVLDVSQIEPPPGKSFMESILCYGILDDHVILLQSLGLQARAFESHLFWLLGESCSGILDNDNGVGLQNYTPQETLEKIKKSPVKNVSLHVPLIEKTEQTQIKGKETTSINVNSARVMLGKGLDVIRAILPEDKYYKMINDVTDPETEIEVFVEIKRTRRKRNLEKESQDFLNAVADQLRHTPENDIKVELVGGSTLSGDELTIKTKKSIPIINGVPDVHHLFLQMSNWMRELIDSEQIEPG